MRRQTDEIRSISTIGEASSGRSFSIEVTAIRLVISLGIAISHFHDVVVSIVSLGVPKYKIATHFGFGLGGGFGFGSGFDSGFDSGSDSG